MEMILLGAVNLVVIFLWGWSLSKILPSVTVERLAATDDSGEKPNMDVALATWGLRAWQERKAA